MPLYHKKHKTQVLLSTYNQTEEKVSIIINLLCRLVSGWNLFITWHIHVVLQRDNLTTEHFQLLYIECLDTLHDIIFSSFADIFIGWHHLKTEHPISVQITLLHLSPYQRGHLPMWQIWVSLGFLPWHWSSGCVFPSSSIQVISLCARPLPQETEH